MQELTYSLRFSVEEMCSKMGMTLPGCSLNLPSGSLMRMLNTNADELSKSVANFCQSFSAAFGNLSAYPYENGWCFVFTAQAVNAIMHRPIGGYFLQATCALSANHHATADQWKSIFSQFGECVLQKTNDAEYDWLLYYPSGQPVNFVYCLKQEGSHISAHRLARLEFEQLSGIQLCHKES